MFQGFIQSAHASVKLEALKDLYTVRSKSEAPMHSSEHCALATQPRAPAADRVASADLAATPHQPSACSMKFTRPEQNLPGRN